MKKTFLICSLFLVFLPVLPQKTDNLLQKAKLFYQNDEFRMAIPLYLQLTEKYPDNFSLCTELGKCYVQTGQIDQGIRFYKKALKIRPDYPEAVYGLGNTYDISDNTDSALYWFRKYTLLKPEDPSGFLRLSVISMDLAGEADSSVYYAQKALILEPSNQSAYYTLAMAYIKNGKYNHAIDAATKGLSYDSTNYLLYYPWGLGLFFQHNYGLAYQVFSRGAKFEDQGSKLISYRAMALIMKNTPPETYTFDDTGQPRFQTFNVRNSDDLDKRITDPLDRYYFPALQKKFNTDPLSMGLDEFFMLYYGYTGSKDYAPYNLKTDSLDHYLSEGQYDKYLQHAENFLSDDPVQFPVYNDLSLVYNINGDKENQYESLFKYYGFKNAVMATGNGKDAGNAFIVINVNHEYDILRNLGLQPAGQKLVTEHDRSFDVLTGKASDGTREEVWFSIDKPFGALNSLMEQRQSKKKGKKR